jgi:hypothetical protein
LSYISHKSTCQVIYYDKEAESTFPPTPLIEKEEEYIDIKTICKFTPFSK